jgi:small redox-active disulfide protein 2
MIIEVCGTGCARCQATKANASKALQELGMKLGEDAMVTEIKDMKQISARGVIITPAVVIDGVKVCEGRIPSAEEIKKWLEERKKA